MIVVADTTPLNYLILIGEAGLLPALFGKVFVPPAVSAELEHPQTPEQVRAWMVSKPNWLTVQAGRPLSAENLSTLDFGEREAIELALDLSWGGTTGLLLIDEARGRSEAIALGLHVRGTLGVLEQAARARMIDLRAALDKLEKTNFRLSAPLREAALERSRAT